MGSKHRKSEKERSHLAVTSFHGKAGRVKEGRVRNGIFKTLGAPVSLPLPANILGYK